MFSFSLFVHAGRDSCQQTFQTNKLKTKSVKFYFSIKLFKAAGVTALKGEEKAFVDKERQNVKKELETALT